MFHIKVTIYYLVAINIITFIVYGVDKLKAKKGLWRIPEATLLLLAVIGGSIGAGLGMCVWHHKTMHPKFKFGVPAILIIQLALLTYGDFLKLLQESSRLILSRFLL